MTILLTVLEIVTPVFLIAGIGFAWVRLGYEYRLAFVTQLAMTIAVPCLVFVALTGTELEPGALSRLGVAAVVAYAAVAAVIYAGLRLAGLDRRTWLAPLTFGNTGNLGLPLALLAFGEEGLGYAVIVFAVTGVFSFTWGLWVVAGGGSPLRALREPLVGATLAAVLVLALGMPVPRVIGTTLDLLGQMAIPLMLLTLGVAVARIHPGRVGLALVLSVVKVIVCVAVGLVVAWAIGLEGIAARVLVLQLATPVAVTSYLLAEKYGAEAEAVAGLVVVSTLLAVLTLPVLLGFLL